MANLDTNTVKTWCPGCGNFALLASLKQALSFLMKEDGLSKENIVVSSGIGCHGKIVDYLNLNTFYSLHGRPIASAEGIKLGNPELKVIACAGDGDAYDEGISHLIHAAKRNSDVTVIIHDNRLFALTTGQFTATSPEGFEGKSTPRGSVEEPFNPLRLMLSSKATFIARGYTGNPKHLQNLIQKGVQHKGFSFIEVLQPCVTFFDISSFYNDKVYETQEDETDSIERAWEKINEWNYTEKAEKIPLGIFYKEEKNSYSEDLLKELNPSKKKEVEIGGMKSVLDRHK